MASARRRFALAALVALLAPSVLGADPASPVIPEAPPEGGAPARPAPPDLPEWARRLLEEAGVLEPGAPGSAPASAPGAPANLLAAPYTIPLDSTRGAWGALTAIGRTDPALAFDPGSRRLLVFGGHTGRAYAGLPMLLDLSGEARWIPVAPRLDGGWGGVGRAAAVVDPARRRALVSGGAFTVAVDRAPFQLCSSSNGVIEIPFDPSGTVRRLEPAGPAPLERYDHAAIWDPPRDRMLVFGGVHRSPLSMSCTSLTLLDDLWELSGGDAPAWRPLEQSGERPRPGARGAAFYDARRDRMVWTGDGGTYALSLGPDHQWTRLPTLNSGPAGFAAAALDSANDRIVAMRSGQVWVLDLGGPLAWLRVLPGGFRPAFGEGTRAVWDAARQRFLVHGGMSQGEGTYATWTWALGFDDEVPYWSLVESSPPTFLRTPMLDRPGDRVLVVSQGFDALVDFDLSARRAADVTTVAAGGPAPRLGEVTLLDARRGRIVMFGDATRAPGSAPDATTWALTLADPPRWEPLPGGPSPVAQQAYPVAVLDEPRDRIVAFGGLTAAQALSEGLWEFPLEGSGGWRPLDVPGPGPGPRVFHGAVHDTRRHRMIVLAGIGTDSTGFLRGMDDVWALTLEPPMRWERLDILGDVELRRRSRFALAYDQARDRLVLHGAVRDNSVETYAVDLSQPTLGWVALDRHCCGRDDFVPVRRFGAGVVYDPRRDATVLFGGLRSLSRGPAMDEVWTLTWGEPAREVRLDPWPNRRDGTVDPDSRGVLPLAILSEPDFDATTVDVASIRFAEAGVRQDRGRHRRDRDHGGSGAHDEDHGDHGRPGRHDPPHVRERDVDGDGRTDLVVDIEMGEMQVGPRDTVAHLVAKAPGDLTLRGSAGIRVRAGCRDAAGEAAAPAAASEAAERPALALAAAWAGRGGSVRVAFSLASGARARLEVIDVAGRRVASRDLAGLPAGRHEVTLGAGCAPGVYVVRLEQDGRAVARKAAIVR